MKKKINPLVPSVLLVALIIALGIAWVFSKNIIPQSSVFSPRSPKMADLIRLGTAPPPEYTDEIKNSLGKTFVLVVSYTDQGFEPAQAKVMRGERIRFVNNSSAQLWVASDTRVGQKYPRIGQECGDTSFDSCVSLEPQGFWEFTFTEKGNWGFTNQLAKIHTGVITVE